MSVSVPFTMAALALVGVLVVGFALVRIVVTERSRRVLVSRQPSSYAVRTVRRPLGELRPLR